MQILLLKGLWFCEQMLFEPTTSLIEQLKFRCNFDGKKNMYDEMFNTETIFTR